MSLTNTMKSLSESERPYEKCEQFGASHLTDTELLAVLLRTGSHGENALDLSRRILYYAGEDGLLGIHRFSKERLKRSVESAESSPYRFFVSQNLPNALLRQRHVRCCSLRVHLPLPDIIWRI